MQIELSQKEFRHLLDLVYIGDWVLNASRGEDRIQMYDKVLKKIFGYCPDYKLSALAEKGRDGSAIPSDAYEEGGIQDAIMDYEDAVFFNILAEELTSRDMNYAPITARNYDEYVERMDNYMNEFELYGTEHLQLDS